jgi:hypothetical protein
VEASPPIVTSAPVQGTVQSRAGTAGVCVDVAATTGFRTPAGGSEVGIAGAVALVVGMLVVDGVGADVASSSLLLSTVAAIPPIVTGVPVQRTVESGAGTAGVCMHAAATMGFRTPAGGSEVGIAGTVILVVEMLVVDGVGADVASSSLSLSSSSSIALFDLFRFF